MTRSDDSVSYQTRALVRALSILDAFSHERRVLAVKDLHLLLELPKPTVSRLTQALESAGYLRRIDGAFELGPKTFQVGSMFAHHHGRLESARRPLEQLAGQASQTACLAELANRSIVHLLVAPSPHPVQHVTEVGSSAPAHATGLGKALLAQLAPRQLERIFGHEPLPRFTPNTICDWDEFLAELRLTRERGYAVDNEEGLAGLKCVAAFVHTSALGPAAVSVSGPASNFKPAAIKSVASMVQAAARAVEEALGEVPTDYRHHS